MGPPAAAAATAAADGKAGEYSGADEAQKVEHEREVLPEDEPATKPASYFSLYRCAAVGSTGLCQRSSWAAGTSTRCAALERLGSTQLRRLPPSAPTFCTCTHLNCTRFADRTDWVLMALGTAGAAGSGAAMPIYSILFGDL